MREAKPQLRITSEFSELFGIHYHYAAKRGRRASTILPILHARAEGLPPGADALVVTSDLQGRAPSWSRGGEQVLLGVQVADELARLADEGLLPPASRIGILLAGDLYAAPGADKRGATGDVTEVWSAFADTFAWVCGVAGNHDLFGEEKQRRRLEARENVALLDGDTSSLGGLRLGGVSYIPGNPEKRGRVEPSEFFARVESVLKSQPEVLLLHEGPSAGPGKPGNPRLRELVERDAPPFVVCGHSHWSEPMAEIGSTQVVNVDARVLVLTA